MEDIDRFKKCFADIWLEISHLVHKSVVYLDYAAAEWLHWHTGGKAYSFLKDAGALSVCEISEMMHILPVCNKNETVWIFQYIYI